MAEEAVKGQYEVYLKYDIDVANAKPVPCEVIEGAFRAAKKVGPGNGVKFGTVLWTEINNWIKQEKHGVWKVPMSDKHLLITTSEDPTFKGWHYAFNSEKAWRDAKPKIMSTMGRGAKATMAMLKQKFGFLDVDGKTHIRLPGARVLGWASIGLDLYEIYEAEGEVKTVNRVVNGWTGAGIGASVFAGWALAGGQMGPQIATPEEIATVPIAAFIGAIVGSIIGREVSDIVYDLVYTRGYAYQ